MAAEQQPQPPIESVDMLKAFERDPAQLGTEALSYPNLDQSAEQARQNEMPLLREFWAAEPGSVEEESLARKAAVGYYVLTGARLHQVHPERQTEVAERFTSGGIELYGEPEQQEFERLAGGKLHEYESYRQNDAVDQARLERVTQFVRSRVPDANSETGLEAPAFAWAAQRLVRALERRYPDVMAIFDTLDPDAKIDGKALGDLFEKGRQLLERYDDGWKEWSTTRADNKALSSEAKSKELIVGTKREPISPKRAKEHFLHEALVHSLRSVNGAHFDDPMAQYGMPGFLDSEEGLAVLMEYGSSGEMSDVRTDRYVDFGLALGTSGQPGATRRELHDHYVDRTIVRKQARGEAVDEAKISASGWRYVNRIYRGGLENDVVSVNTKDLAYYRGFVLMGNFVAKLYESGMSDDEVLDFILQAKIDPTNKRHVAKLPAKK